MPTDSPNPCPVCDGGYSHEPDCPYGLRTGIRDAGAAVGVGTRLANGYPLIYMGPDGQWWREGRPIASDEAMRFTNPQYVARARAEWDANAAREDAEYRRTKGG